MKPLLLTLSLLFIVSSTQAQPIPVELVQNEDGNWQLLRDGEPYFVQGAGGGGSLELLAESGGNTIRTWGVGDDTEDLLDEAHSYGLSVIVGHWLGHERHGFDYSNPQMLDDQREQVRQDVLRFKDHPAVLMWALGNEMEGFEDGGNPAIWNHVQELASMVKELDPNHPIMTVTAEIGGERVRAVHKITKDIDIHGVNTYGGLPSMIDRYKQQGGTKPIIITEFGPPGTWETGTTSFGAPIELTSSEKATIYREAYQQGCLDHPDTCLGGLAFTWGSKMEATATWFGMFLPTGEKLAAVDAMTKMWSGNPPENLSPVIEKFELNGSNELKAGERFEINLEAYDPEGKDLRVDWVVRGEASEYFTGGDVQQTPFELSGIIQQSSKMSATLVAPTEGVYRIYVKVYDSDGGAAVANIPIKTTGTTEPVQLALPLAVYADEAPQPWFSSGWMGNTEKIEMDLESDVNPKSGKYSLEVTYRGFDGWAGVAWQHPLKDWGQLPGGFNLTGAKKLTFWARGKNGGERISFGIGILADDVPYNDTVMKELSELKLSDDWKKYTINLEGEDLSQIKTPFYWRLGSPGFPVTFYLDHIQFE